MHPPRRGVRSRSGTSPTRNRKENNTFEALSGTVNHSLRGGFFASSGVVIQRYYSRPIRMFIICNYAIAKAITTVRPAKPTARKIMLVLTFFPCQSVGRNGRKRGGGHEHPGRGHRREPGILRPVPHGDEGAVEGRDRSLPVPDVVKSIEGGGPVPGQSRPPRAG